MDMFFSMRIFRQVVESGSFTAAGEAMGLSVAMTSKHLRLLEDHLNVRLLNRTSRRLALSAAGLQYYERVCEILNSIDEAENELRFALHQPQGTLRITAPAWFGNSSFADLLCSYQSLYPKLKLDIMLSDTFVNLVDEGIDVALRVAMSLDERLPARKLGEVEFVLAASQGYLEARGRPQTVEELRGHEVISYSYDPASVLGVPVTPSVFLCNSTTLIAHLAARDVGLAVLPRTLVEKESWFRDQFEIILPGVKLPSPTLYAVTHERRRQVARVATFLDFLQESLLQK
jgi:DNA-binding transcriptional LysR family regulator